MKSSACILLACVSGWFVPRLREKLALLQIINFHQTDTSGVILPAHNCSVVARGECLECGCLTRIARCKFGGFDFGRAGIVLPVVVGRKDRPVRIVQLDCLDLKPSIV
jgi:hypothetical protein